jgi:hypothetical protein
VEFGIGPDLGWLEHHDHKPLAPQFGDDRLFVPDTLVSFPRVSSFFGSSDGVGVIDRFRKLERRAWNGKASSPDLECSCLGRNLTCIIPELRTEA